MKRIFFGKKIDGKCQIIPKMNLFGGCLFFNWLNFSIMFVLPNWLIEELSYWGIDAIGD